MQLVAYGAQDVYLTGSPQITFFKTVYRRHTNFAMQSIEQSFSGTAAMGRKVICNIGRNGDLIADAFLEVTLKKGSTPSFYPADRPSTNTTPPGCASTTNCSARTSRRKRTAPSWTGPTVRRPGTSSASTCP